MTSRALELKPKMTERQEYQWDGEISYEDAADLIGEIEREKADLVAAWVDEGNDYHRQIASLESQLHAAEQERDLCIGWMYAWACKVMDRGIDVRKAEFPAVIKEMKKDLAILESD